MIFVFINTNFYVEGRDNVNTVSVRAHKQYLKKKKMNEQEF